MKFKLVHILGLNFIFLTGNTLWFLGGNQLVEAKGDPAQIPDENHRESSLETPNENILFNLTEDKSPEFQPLTPLVPLWTIPVEKVIEKEKRVEKENLIEKKMITAQSNSENKETYQKLLNKLKAELAASNAINASLVNRLNDVQQIVDIKNDQINTLQKANKILRVENLPAIKSDVELVKEAIESEPDIIKFEAVPSEPDKPIINIEDQIVSTEENINKGVYDKPAKPSNFSGSVEFGFSYSENSIQTRDMNGRFVATYEEKEKFKLNSEINFELREEDSSMTASNMRWQLQGDRYFNPRNFMYVSSDLLRSDFTSYDEEDTYTIGYGRVILAQEKNELNIEIGSGYRRALPNVDADADAESINEAILSIGVYNKHSLSSSVQIGLDSELEFGMENSIYSTSLKLQNKIYRQLFLISESNYKYTKNVPDGTSNKDLSTNLKLKYAF